MLEPLEVSDIQMAFPANVIGTYLPPMEDIPDKYKNHNSDAWYHKLVGHWFFKGLPADTKFFPRKGIDPDLAFRHIRCILGSFQPQHEHKEAGCAYLLDQWFEKVEMS